MRFYYLCYLLPSEVVAAAGVDHGVHAAVDPAKPGQDGEGQLRIGDTLWTDACR